MLMAVIGVVIRALSLLGLYLISNPKRLRLDAPLPLEGENTEKGSGKHKKSKKTDSPPAKPTNN